MKVTNSFTLETSMFCKTKAYEAKESESAVMVDRDDKGQKLNCIQLTIADLH